MSTTSPTATLTDSTTTTTPTSSSSNSDTATLYLFTFLATILILVLLSSSLVLRSYIIRRRYRRRFQQALADGLFPDLDRSVFNGQFDPLGFRRYPPQPGPKPVVWDTWTRPADKADAWSSITPVAVRCTPLLSPPSSSISLPQPSTAPSDTLFSQLRFRSPFSLSPRPSSPLPGQAPSPPATRSPPSDPSTYTEKDAAMLAVCVLVAMPDVSAPVHRPAPDPKGKGVDPPLQAQADALSPLHRGARISDTAPDEEGLPLLEFGVVEMRMGESAWRT